MFVTTPDILQKWLIYLKDTSGLTDRCIASKPLFSGMPPGTINTIRKHGKIPNKWKSRFGMSASVKVKCCQIHGIVHRYDCATEKAVPVAARVSLPGKPRKRAPRIEIALSDPTKARARLEQALQEME